MFVTLINKIVERRRAKITKIGLSQQTRLKTQLMTQCRIIISFIIQ